MADLAFRIHDLEQAGVGAHRGAAGSLADAVQLASAFYIAREAASVAVDLCIVVIDDATGSIAAWVGQWPSAAPEALPAR